jgi:hypothetical protein
VKLCSALFAFLLLPIFSSGQSAPPSKESLATVDGQALTDEDLAPYVQSQLRPLREQEYQIKKKALDTLITQRVLEAEATKKGLTTEKLLTTGVPLRVVWIASSLRLLDSHSRSQTVFFLMELKVAQD